MKAIASSIESGSVKTRGLVTRRRKAVATIAVTARPVSLGWTLGENSVAPTATPQYRSDAESQAGFRLRADCEAVSRNTNRSKPNSKAANRHHCRGSGMTQRAQR